MRQRNRSERWLFRYADVTMDIGAQHWKSTPGYTPSQASVEFIVTTLPASGSTTSIHIVAQALPASGSQQNLGTDFAAVSYPGNLLATGAFPTSLPSPSAISNTNTADLFYVTNAAGYEYLSYTGQSCAIGSAGSSAPMIAAGGIAPIYSSGGPVQPGSWISIFGTSLAPAAATWNNDFPAQLGGVSVTIDNKPAYLWYVSPTQINLQVPDDAARGAVVLVITTSAGSVSATVTLAAAAPSLSLLDATHVAGAIVRQDGSGAYGGGTYDILGPTGTSLGYRTVAAKPGDHVVLYGVGFGSTTPSVPAGKPFSGSALTDNPVTLNIGGGRLKPDYAGQTGAGLYQINLTIPSSLGAGDVLLEADVQGLRTQPGVVMALEATEALVKSLSLSASIAGSRAAVQGTVTLSSAAPATGISVSLSSNSAAVFIPSSVLVPAGATTATFTLTTAAFTTSQSVTLTAAYAGHSVQATLTVTPATASSPFVQLAVVPTFQPAGFPPMSTATFTVTPDPGNATFTACIEGCGTGATLIQGVASNQGKTFTFNTLGPGRNLVLFSGSSSGLLSVSSASLTFTLTQTSSSPGIVIGTVAGTLTLTGTPYSAAGAAVTLSGPISGTYTTTLP